MGLEGLIRGTLSRCRSECCIWTVGSRINATCKDEALISSLPSHQHRPVHTLLPIHILLFR